ncbi:ATPase, T2SS/T4P/T4SS family [Aeoliella sp.]|uniref:ATPase, T2SS/T4P/T4SS family n=1 Tax=Aeoliella sp. TaxID=2795800 RepID=UPI003CCBDBE7
MQRLIWLLFIALVVGLAGPTAPVAFAQEEEAQPAEGGEAGDQADDGADNADGEEAAGGDAAKPAAGAVWTKAQMNAKRGPAFLSWLKLIPVILLVLLWIVTADWVNRSSQRHGLGYGKWNPIIFFPFVLALLLLVMVPIYAVGIGALTLAYLVPFIMYTVAHNKSVETHEKVFTADWFRYITGRGEPMADYEKGAPVDLSAFGGDDKTNQGNLITARQSPGYLLVKEMIADMATRRSDRMVLDYMQGGVNVKHLIDGVWHNGEGRDRESGDVMLAVMKQLANLDITERRQKQAGQFGAKYEGVQYLCPFVSQGVKTGERVLLEMLGGAQTKLLTYDDLGMREKIKARWEELMALDEGVLVIAAPPEGGLTTLTDVSILETDRLMRDFVAIEDVHHPERDMENVALSTFDSKKGETPATLLPQLIRTYPNVYIVRDLVDRESAKILLGEVQDNHLLITTVPAMEAAEAMLRVLQKKVPQKEFAENLTAVLCTRLIRKLCNECKIGFEPTPDMLKKLGLPPGKVQQLYRTPKPEELEKPCLNCNNVGYVGRTGLFELLVADDKVREVLIKQPKLDLLRKAGRLAGMRTFQEEAILLVAKGVTSIPEAQRILKGA